MLPVEKSWKIPSWGIPTYQEQFEREDTHMMMGGYDYNWFGMSMMMLGMVVSIALMVVIIWAVVRWLNNRKTLTMPSMRQPQDSYQQDSYQRYEQGYEPHQPPISTFQGAELQSQYQQPEYDQPQAQYPQEMPLQQRRN